MYQPVLILPVKYTLTLLLFLFLSYFSFAQHEFLNINDHGNYDKGIKVKTLTVYHSETETDSTLTTIHTYDSLGNWLTTKTFSKDGNIFSVDTCIYDDHHYLMRYIYRSVSDKYEVDYTNEVNGKHIHSKTIADSGYSE